MPTLKRYADGRGFYLIGRVPDAGSSRYCTWQIGRPGLAYLAVSGIKTSGDAVRVELLRCLIDGDLISTGGRGSGSISPTTPHPDWVEALSACLETWAGDGRVAALARIVCPAGGVKYDRRTRCFPPAFLEWAGSLDARVGLTRLADITASEFESLAADTLAEVNDPLFARFAERGAIGVVWRLARVVGLVAVQLRSGAVCPDVWRDEPVLSWLFGRLKDFTRATSRPTVPRRFVGWAAPRVVWQVDLQQVVAVLPSQRGPEGCDGLSWQIAGQSVTPRVVVGPRGRAVEESSSGPLRPADRYVIDLTNAESARWTIDTPPESPAVLFHAAGCLVDGEDADPLPPGRYLALVRPGLEATVRAFRGVTLVHPVDVGPVGWGGWSGWHAELSPAAAVPGYRVAAEAPALHWRVELPPDPGVQWLHAEPVYVGHLPELTLDNLVAFRAAPVRVTVGGGGANEEDIYLTLGRDVPLVPEGDGGSADLNAAPQLRGRYGRFRLWCQPPCRPDHPPLVLQFTRLPEMRVEYVPDPVRPTAVAAVRVTPTTPHPGLAAGSDTEFRLDGASVLLRALTPESAPGVRAGDPVGGWELRVRVGVARGCRLAPRHGLTAWSPLPVRDIDLATVELDDRLRVEFPTPPFTHEGKIIFRLAGREDVHAGEPLDRLDQPRVFEVKLHRWRDSFGVGSSGIVQARLEAGWVDVAGLTATGTGSLPPPPPETPWQRLAAEVNAAVDTGDDTSALIGACLAAATGPSVSPIAADLLPVAAARAALAASPPAEWAPVRAALAPLTLRADLPEARLLAATFEVRQDGAWSYARLEAVRKTLPPETADAAVVEAECWYRQARSHTEFAPGCWESCLKLCDRFVSTSGATGGLAVSDAVLLRELAGLMLNQPSRPSVLELLPGHRAWVAAVRAAGLFVRQPWGGVASGVAGLADPAPSVLCRQDEALIRVLAGMSTGHADLAVHWRQVQPLGVGFFDAMPLLQARYARATGDRAGATAGYTRAHEIAMAADDFDMVEVIAAERI